MYQGFHNRGTLLVNREENTVINEAMKTKLTISVLFLLMNTFMLSGRDITSTTSDNDTLSVSMIDESLPMVEEETYINDIPFNTAEVAMKSFYVNLAKPEEETFVNDIPFDTQVVVAIYTYVTHPVVVEEEAYIDDIPFDTEAIAREYLQHELGFANRLNQRICD